MEFLPAQSSSIKSLNRAQVLYILSIYYLETLRANTGTFKSVFTYLEDVGITSNEALAECVMGIAEKVENVFFDSL